MTERERLIELLNDMIDKNKNKNITTETMADYLLENDVTFLPCKVGDIVYQLDSAGDIYESEVTQVVYGTNGIAFDERTIGKSVFLTREEVEKEIERRTAQNGLAYATPNFELLEG